MRSPIADFSLVTDERINVGWIMNDKAQLGTFAVSYIEELKRLIKEYGY